MLIKLKNKIVQNVNKNVEIVDVKCKIKFRRDHVATKWDEGCLVNVNIG